VIELKVEGMTWLGYRVVGEREVRKRIVYSWLLLSLSSLSQVHIKQPVIVAHRCEWIIERACRIWIENIIKGCIVESGSSKRVRLRLRQISGPELLVDRREWLC
jgi:hypothetical protein